jgi:hypothetical protein
MYSLVHIYIYYFHSIPGNAASDPDATLPPWVGTVNIAKESRLAVISVNMLFAALAVNEFLARLHPYRVDPNSMFSIHTFSFSHAIYEPRAEGEPCPTLTRHIGRGDKTPLLDLPILGRGVSQQ